MNDQPDFEPRVLQLLRKMLSLHEAEVDCDTCDAQLDCLADLMTAGCEPEKALHAVQNHLECCAECNEEFEALSAILRAEQNGECERLYAQRLRDKSEKNVPKQKEE